MSGRLGELVELFETRAMLRGVVSPERCADGQRRRPAAH